MEKYFHLVSKLLNTGNIRLYLSHDTGHAPEPRLTSQKKDKKEQSEKKERLTHNSGLEKETFLNWARQYSAEQSECSVSYRILCTSKFVTVPTKKNPPLVFILRQTNPIRTPLFTTHLTLFSALPLCLPRGQILMFLGWMCQRLSYLTRVCYMPRSSYCFHLVILITGLYSSWQFGCHPTLSCYYADHSELSQTLFH
jgi:hypothetical protein